jgi:SAM-dependent methyltransferase
LTDLVPCPICGMDRHKVYAVTLREHYPHTVRVRCSNCGNTYANPPATVADLQDFYTGYYEKGNFKERETKQSYERWAANIRRDRKSHATAELQAISRYRHERGRFLDIGTGLGIPLLFAELEGFSELHGTDLDINALGFAEMIVPRANFFRGELIEAQYPSSYFDYVHFFHVIEHVRDPRRYLQEIHRILKPSGICYIATPNISNSGYTLYRALSFAVGHVPQILDGLEHTVAFAYAGLRRLCSETGFTVLEHKKDRSSEPLHRVLTEGVGGRKRLVRMAQKLFCVNQHIVLGKCTSSPKVDGAI